LMSARGPRALDSDHPLTPLPSSRTFPGTGHRSPFGTARNAELTFVQDRGSVTRSNLPQALKLRCAQGFTHSFDGGLGKRGHGRSSWVMRRSRIVARVHGWATVLVRGCGSQTRGPGERRFPVELSRIHAIRLTFHHGPAATGRFTDSV